MLDWLDFFNNPDWNGKLRALLASLDTADPRFLGVIVAIALFVGSKVVSGQPSLRRLGLRFGAGTFLAYLGYAYASGMSFESAELPGLALRAFNAGGIVLGFTWIVLPVLNFLLTHLRVAIAAFLGYGAYALWNADNFSAEHLQEIGLRGLIAVALALVVAWILQPIGDYIRSMLPQPKAPPKEDGDPEPKPRWRGRRRRAPETMPAETPAPAAPAIATVLASQLEILSSQLEQIAPQSVDGQRRRDRVRLQVEMHYVLAVPHLGGRLTREVFDEFVNRYLGDHLPPEVVEENSKQLLAILHERQRQAHDAPAASVEELARRLLDAPKHGNGVAERSAPLGL